MSSTLYVSDDIPTNRTVIIHKQNTQTGQSYAAISTDDYDYDADDEDDDFSGICAAGYDFDFSDEHGAYNMDDQISIPECPEFLLIKAGRMAAVISPQHMYAIGDNNLEEESRETDDESAVKKFDKDVRSDENTCDVDKEPHAQANRFDGPPPVDRAKASPTSPIDNRPRIGSSTVSIDMNNDGTVGVPSGYIAVKSEDSEDVRIVRKWNNDVFSNENSDNEERVDVLVSPCVVKLQALPFSCVPQTELVRLLMEGSLSD